MLEKGKNCQNCRYFDASPAAGGNVAADPAATVAPPVTSLCRNAPPTPTPDGKSAIWPVVTATDWCGEWTGGQG